jgi:hypothetical protein
MEQIKLKLPELDFVNLPYSPPILDIKDDVAYESVNKQYRLAGYTEENTQYHMCWPVTDDYMQFVATLFDKTFTLSVLKQRPGQTIPIHSDSFGKIAYEFSVDPKDCIRVNIFLENWKSGHYFEIDHNPITKWERGDAVIIGKDTPHLSANNGMEPKFTMQITGPKSEFKWC